ncbi:tetratricopeptide repeat protein [Polyangium sorediatum]|uniref:Tetratricopeptide repeat protein n=1 Tax=Polyangium sorediatum TaxID=889274 RepID=A0ABT6NVF0_9BACT|nr:hypothetical protein [Polyangium sorediatum]MDI1432325.1 hypothetical protein [Polyangium sorediatum]
MRVKVSALGIVVLVCLCGGRADAGPAEDRAAADALFEEGRELLKAGRAAEACPKFAASQKLHPRPGRLLQLGDCYEKNGETARAWETFREAESAARVDKDERRMEVASQRAGDLEPKLAKLVVEVPPEARVAGLLVRRNGKSVEATAWGVAVPVDPGEQRIEVTAPGKKAWVGKVVVEGKPGVTTAWVPALVDEVKGEQVGAGKEEGAGKSWVAIGVGAGLALAGIGTGVGLLVAAGGAGEEADALDDAMPDMACDPTHPDHAANKANCATLLSTVQRKDTFTNVGTGALVAGGVLAVGTVVYALLPTKKQATMGFTLVPTVTPTFAGFAATGQF